METGHIASSMMKLIPRYHSQPAMGYRRAGVWHQLSFRDMGDRVRNLAMGLLKLGVEPGDRVGIFSANRMEWSIADLAVLSIRGVVVPIYATSIADQVAYMCRDSGLKVLFVGDSRQAEVVGTIRAQVPALKVVVRFDSERSGGELSIEALEADGQRSGLDGRFDSRLQAGTGDELATIIYTSGTTGEPKGVMLTHSNMGHQYFAIGKEFPIGPGDRSICFLPLSHSYERAWTFYVLLKGATNYYLENPKEVVDELPRVRPNVMSSVPRLYEKVYQGAMHKASIASPAKRRLFHWALGVGLAHAYAVRRGRRPGPVLKASFVLADKLVLARIREVMGGPKKFMSCGGAPLGKEVEEFFLASGMMLCQGYGLTETSPTLTANTPSAFRFGTVGKPVDKVQIKISDQGEILAKGPNVMQGYFNKPEATAEVFEDGWFRTGDVGEFDPDGYLVITDRIKNLIITSGGKNIAPQRIEQVLARDIFIEQMAVIGDRRPFISALIVPNFVALEPWARDENLSFQSREELIALPQVRELFEQKVELANRELARYEAVKAFRLIPREFSIEQGEMTPTLKLKRRVVLDRFQELVEEMYRD